MNFLSQAFLHPHTPPRLLPNTKIRYNNTTSSNWSWWDNKSFQIIHLIKACICSAEEPKTESRNCCGRETVFFFLTSVLITSCSVDIEANQVSKRAIRWLLEDLEFEHPKAFKESKSGVRINNFELFNTFNIVICFIFIFTGSCVNVCRKTIDISSPQEYH